MEQVPPVDRCAAVAKVYLVDNSQLGATTQGLGYRIKKDMKPESKDKNVNATWDSFVVGVDEGDGWLRTIIPRTGIVFLPMIVENKRVISEAHPGMLAEKGLLPRMPAESTISVAKEGARSQRRSLNMVGGDVDEDDITAAPFRMSEAQIQRSLPEFQLSNHVDGSVQQELERLRQREQEVAKMASQFESRLVNAEQSFFEHYHGAAVPDGELEVSLLSTFKAINSELNANTFGLGFRKTKDASAEAKSGMILEWGATVEGLDEGDGWVRIEQTGFLPLAVVDKQVLVDMSEGRDQLRANAARNSQSHVLKQLMRVRRIREQKARIEGHRKGIEKRLQALEHHDHEESVKKLLAKEQEITNKTIELERRLCFLETDLPEDESILVQGQRDVAADNTATRRELQSDEAISATQLWGKVGQLAGSCEEKVIQLTKQLEMMEQHPHHSHEKHMDDLRVGEGELANNCLDLESRLNSLETKLPSERLGALSQTAVVSLQSRHRELENEAARLEQRLNALDGMVPAGAAQRSLKPDFADCTKMEQGRLGTENFVLSMSQRASKCEEKASRLEAEVQELGRYFKDGAGVDPRPTNPDAESLRETQEKLAISEMQRQNLQEQCVELQRLLAGFEADSARPGPTSRGLASPEVQVAAPEQDKLLQMLREAENSKEQLQGQVEQQKLELDKLSLAAQEFEAAMNMKSQEHTEALRKARMEYDQLQLGHVQQMQQLQDSLAFQIQQHEDLQRQMANSRPQAVEYSISPEHQQLIMRHQEQLQNLAAKEGALQKASEEREQLILKGQEQSCQLESLQRDLQNGNAEREQLRAMHQEHIRQLEVAAQQALRDGKEQSVSEYQKKVQELQEQLELQRKLYEQQATMQSGALQEQLLVAQQEAANHAERVRYHELRAQSLEAQIVKSKADLNQATVSSQESRALLAEQQRERFAVEEAHKQALLKLEAELARHKDVVQVAEQATNQERMVRERAQATHQQLSEQSAQQENAMLALKAELAAAKARAETAEESTRQAHAQLAASSQQEVQGLQGLLSSVNATSVAALVEETIALRLQVQTAPASAITSPDRGQAQSLSQWMQTAETCTEIFDQGVSTAAQLDEQASADKQRIADLEEVVKAQKSREEQLMKQVDEMKAVQDSTQKRSPSVGSNSAPYLVSANRVQVKAPGHPAQVDISGTISRHSAGTASPSRTRGNIPLIVAPQVMQDTSATISLPGSALFSSTPSYPGPGLPPGFQRASSSGASRYQVPASRLSPTAQRQGHTASWAGPVAVANTSGLDVRQASNAIGATGVAPIVTSVELPSSPAGSVGLPQPPLGSIAASSFGSVSTPVPPLVPTAVIGSVGSVGAPRTPVGMPTVMSIATPPAGAPNGPPLAPALGPSRYSVPQTLPNVRGFQPAVVPVLTPGAIGPQLFSPAFGTGPAAS